LENRLAKTVSHNSSVEWLLDRFQWHRKFNEDCNCFSKIIEESSRIWIHNCGNPSNKWSSMNNRKLKKKFQAWDDEIRWHNDVIPLSTFNSSNICCTNHINFIFSVTRSPWTQFPLSFGSQWVQTSITNTACEKSITSWISLIVESIEKFVQCLRRC
jgi:hypothetical protein